ncbi:MAG: DNA polymerase IV [Bacteroidetes bacterium]|nr:DNA polymerase IV [Bacteroidota bacterium]MBU1114604.1 DNA polymerase IV [Bacteroidota bacterium]MBU1797826.1 DNA polymerase IV [Bacteroidota bacterium]
MKTIFHLDLDTFFVSVERILDPNLIGKPVIVGGNPEFGRGVVAACSYEAREFGLHSAMPIKQAYKLCPNGIYVSGTMGEYSRFSEEVKKILERYSPIIQQASIDEFYMDFTGTAKIYGSMFALGKKIQDEIKRELLLPCSIGIGSNKTIAKIGSDYGKPFGITYILPGMEKEFLAPLPVEVIPGVGRVMLESLNSKGFFKVKDITELSEEYFALTYGKAGTALWSKANGFGSSNFNINRERLSISKERTYGKDEVNITKIEDTLFNLTGKVCQLLRDKNWEAATVSIKLRYSDFVTITRAKTIKATNDDKIIFETALKLLKNAYTRRVAVRLIGIHLTNFSEFNTQETLFDNENVVRKDMLKAVTSIRDKFGFSSIKFGNSGAQK